jgi:hypothetical protein
VIIELLYFDGCPNHVPARSLVETVLADHAVAAEIREVEVRDPADAQSKRFLGSPTIRVDGIDIEPEVAHRDIFGMVCRIYRDGIVLRGVPPRQLIEGAMQKALATRSAGDD